MPVQLKADGQPVKTLWIGDLIIPTGFGRIGNEVVRRAAGRGWQILGASLPYGGYPFNNVLPVPVIPLGGKDQNGIWSTVAGVIATERPDVVVVCQDFPYSVTTFHNLRIDWSQIKFICITPIDGTPVHPQWLDLVNLIDGTMVISKFGVEAMRLAGRQVDLLHPGVDTNEFYPAEDKAEVAALRAKVGIPEDAFVTGSFMMNQGRKMVSRTIETFGDFARDKPNAYLYLDMETQSPAGWDIPATMQQLGFSDDIKKRVITREAVMKPGGIDGLHERYLLCDTTSQLSHREGFGLPNLESMACKVPPMVLDWCSGTELAEDGKAVLIRRLDYMEVGTWGGARDAFPDVSDWLNKWNTLYRERDKLAEYAGRGYRWAAEQTWDKATDQFEAVLKRVVEQQKKERAKANDTQRIISPTPALSDTGDGRGNPAPITAHANDIHHSASLQQLTDSDRTVELSGANG